LDRVEIPSFEVIAPMLADGTILAVVRAGSNLSATCPRLPEPGPSDAIGDISCVSSCIDSVIGHVAQC
jgi:hypothetical protein